MNIKNWTVVGAAALVAATLCASAAQASDGTITFTGQITAQTCTINGGGGTFTVPLQPISSSAFTAAGDTAGPTTFTITLSACSFATGNVSTLFEAGTTVDNTNHRLNNMSTDPGAATHVQVELLSGATVMTLGQATPALENSPSAAIAGNAAILTYGAQYYANGGIPTAGPLTTSVTYSLVYN